MRLLLVACLLLASLAPALAAITFPQPGDCSSMADNTFNFETPVGKLSTCQSYNSLSGGFTTNVCGFKINTGGGADTAWDLFSSTNQANPGSNGLGLDGSDSNNEITNAFYVQLDLTDIDNNLYPGSNIGLTMVAVQTGQGFDVYESNTAGQLGTKIFSHTNSGSDAQDTSFVQFPVTQQFLAITGTSASVGALLQQLNFEQCVKKPIVVGDPAFVGLRGQQFQVHGVAGEVYSIVSAKDLQYNARFVFLSEGDCPIVNGKKQKGCFSHPGSYLGELGLKTRAGDKIRIMAGDSKQGFQQIEVNGRSLAEGESVMLSDDLGFVSYNNTHQSTVEIGAWSFVFENSDKYINQYVRVFDIKGLRAHGLLGQTWKETTYPNAIKYIQGQVDDYAIRESDVFGDSFVYNQFN